MPRVRWRIDSAPSPSVAFGSWRDADWGRSRMVTVNSMRWRRLAHAHTTPIAEDTRIMRMALSTRAWTLAELDRLPNDGNRYELVDGELFVTPAPSTAHEELAAALLSRLVPYVQSQHIGRVYTPRAVVRTLGSEVEPDLMVRPAMRSLPDTWAEMPTPLLVVEILSATTRRRDHEQKRAFYMRIGVAEYWIVDRWSRSIRVVRSNTEDLVTETVLEWQPKGAHDVLRVDVARYFAEALGTPP